MLRLFMDASVIFAMAHSDKGASREILNLAQARNVGLITSEYAMREAVGRIQHDYPAVLPKLYEIRASDVFAVVDANESDVAAAAFFVNDVYDAPILAAARLARVDAMVSFDRKHLHTLEVSNYIGAPVITSAQALQMIRAQKY